jgi:hypothetical protein
MTEAAVIFAAVYECSVKAVLLGRERHRREGGVQENLKIQIPSLL